MTRLLFILFFSCAAANAFAENSIAINRPAFVRKEPVEKEIWYSGLTTKAILFYEKACGSGEAKACFNLGLIFDTGEMAVQNKKKAAEAYRLACDGGSALGCNNLGILFGTGEGGQQDLRQASDYFSKSCQLDEEAACTNQKMLLEMQNGH